MRGVFYNSKKSLCSIWESGKMCYTALCNSKLFILDYSEEQILDTSYDFAIFNQHFTVNNWMTHNDILLFGKPTYCIVTEVSLDGNPVSASPTFFSNYIVLDPTITETDNIHGFGRPLEDINISNNIILSESKPKIGSFGFATGGKNWHKIVEAVQCEYDIADIHFNIPHGTHVPDYIHNQHVNEIYNECLKIITKPGIQLKITHNNFSKTELIKFCSENTINCFFYEREHMFSSGLSAVTDQAISSGRPLLVTKDKTFRHIHKYMDFYPNIDIKTAIETSTINVSKMKYDWSSKNFLLKFETILIKTTHLHP